VSHVVANGLRFHVQRLDAGHPGEPVVMLHGLLVGNLTTWYFTAASALAARHPVLLYDLRGHGRSEHAADGYDVATMTRDLAALTADYERTPMTLVGHSYGALIALRFALDHPDRVARLALVEAPLPPSRMGELEELTSRTPQQMVEALPVDVRAFVARGSRRARKLVESLARLTTRSTLLADLRAEPDIPDEQLAALRCPVLLVYGSDSSCRPVGDRLARAIPGAQLTVLPGGHYLHLDDGPALTEHLVRFVDG